MLKELENKKISKTEAGEILLNFTNNLDLKEYIEKEKIENFTLLNKDYKVKVENIYAGTLQNNKNNSDEIFVKVDKWEVPTYFKEDKVEADILLKNNKFYPHNHLRVKTDLKENRFYGQLDNGILKKQHAKSIFGKNTVNSFKKNNESLIKTEVELDKQEEKIDFENVILKYLNDIYLKDVAEDYKKHVINIFKSNVLSSIDKEGKIRKFKFKPRILEMFSGYKNYDLEGYTLKSILNENKDFTLVISSDTEFINVVGQDNKEETVLLSNQYAFYWSGYIYTFTFICKKIYTAKLGIKTFLQHILRFIDKNLFLINNRDKGTNRRLSICLLHHFGRADMQHYKEFETVFFKGFATQIQGGIESVKPLPMNIKYKNNVKNDTLEYKVFIHFRDTMAYCSGEKSLARQTQEQFFKKIDDPKIDKSNMLNYLITNPKEFINYADMDAIATLELAYKIWGFNTKYPYTIGQSSVNSFIDTIMEKIFGTAIENPKKIFAFLYNGSFKADIETVDSNGKLVNKEIFTHLSLNITNSLAYYTNSYHGGLNQCYTRGYYTILTTDFDLTSAYPTLMSCVPMVNMLVPFTEYIDISPEEALEKLDEFKEFNVACGVVSWDFSLSKEKRYRNHGCVAQKIQNNLVFTSKGSNVAVAGADLYRILSLGVVTKIERLIIPSTLEGEYIFKDYYKKTIKIRNKFKKIFGKKSIQQEIIKLKNNSLYGKTAQGLSASSISSYINKVKVTEQMPTCDLTNPIYATCITALVRTYLTDVIALLEEKEYKVYSVTTDGFITNLTDIITLDKLTQEDYYIKYFTHKILAICREIQDNKDLNSIWEVKHTNTSFFNITTRGNFAVNDAGVLACAGAKVLKNFKNRNTILHYLLKYNGKVQDKFLKLTTLSEQLLNEEVLSGVIILKTNFYIEFDGKNIPIIDTCKIVDCSIKNKTFKVLNFETRQPADKEEYLKFKRLLKKYKNATYNTDTFYKLMQEFNSIHLDNTIINKVKTTKNTDYKEVKNFLTNYITTNVNNKIIKFFKDYTRQEIIEFLNINFLEHNNKKLTKNIYENIQREIKKLAEAKKEIKKLEADYIELKILEHIKSKK